VQHDVKQNAQAVVVGPQIPVITNLKKDLSVDLDAIRLNVRYLVDRGIVTGKGVLLAVGAGGDFDVLTLDERKAVARAIVEAADGRVPVTVGIQDTNPQVSIDLARHAESLGAYGIQASPPYYHPPSDEDALRLFRGIHDATSKIAIMIYNTWWHHYNIPLAVLDQLVELERVVAIKWSHPGGALDYAQGVRRYCRRVAVIDNALMCVLTHLLGGHGFITHFATVWPEHELKIWSLCQSGRYKEAMEMHASGNFPWVAFQGKIGGRTSGESPPVKAALELTGRPGGPCRPPSRELTREERAELRDLLRSVGVPNVS
jgi:dihydrodipicolinate synthase/N-acetylneuraminate lyase